ncbi:unnamed protein product [Brachionus calyciflorus]|uniref:BED-type domain-containing protein n=1 Tax=Brachionus calyciflorus TaxID=104777 RepID=A0A814DB57_9BILA|nr:unnamed protein product [Brachionus calyciflorus]
MKDIPICKLCSTQVKILNSLTTELINHLSEHGIDEKSNLNDKSSKRLRLDFSSENKERNREMAYISDVDKDGFSRGNPNFLLNNLTYFQSQNASLFDKTAASPFDINTQNNANNDQLEIIEECYMETQVVPSDKINKTKKSISHLTARKNHNPEIINGKYVEKNINTKYYGCIILPKRKDKFSFCSALMWIDEKLAGTVNSPLFGIC